MTRDLYLQQMDHINRIVGHLAQRGGLTREEREDFASALHVKLIDKDYAVFREFKHVSSLEAYLNTVIAHFFQDYRNKEMGKWRPSAAARRLGSLAVTLERLTHRDGYRFEEACNLMHTHHGPAASEREMARLYEQLPPRTRRTDVGDEPIGALADPVPNADEQLLMHEREARHRQALVAMRRAMETLERGERVLVRMHYHEGVAIARLARSLGQDQRKLYRRLDRIREKLKASLQQAGITEVNVEHFLE